eukprot:SAG11_NODE_3069_length_2714_cov_2.084512_3_plen_69_part_00
MQRQGGVEMARGLRTTQRSDGARATAASAIVVDSNTICVQSFTAINSRNGLISKSDATMERYKVVLST